MLQGSNKINGSDASSAGFKGVHFSRGTFYMFSGTG